MELNGYREAVEYLVRLFPGKAFIDVSEFAQITGLDVKTIREYLQDKTNSLPYKVIGKKRIVIPIPSLARWMVN